jgi:lipopolysaccharide transport system permease protein
MENTLPYETVLEPPKSWLALRLGELWEFRELLYFLTWRDIKVRYKQTLLGATWAIIQPVFTMVIFSVIFGRLAKLPSDGIPYPIFSYTALLPWQLFSRAMADASSSLTTNQNMITKIYFPRLFLPASSILGGLVDFGIAFLVLLGLMVYYQTPLTWRVLWLPAFILLALVTAMAVGMWLSAVNVRYRDVKYVTPFLVQIWLYATPIAYSRTLIPDEWQLIYSLNPMSGVVDGFRWVLLGQSVEIGWLFSVSVLMVVVLFIGGLIYFQRMERTFADLI